MEEYLALLEESDRNMKLYLETDDPKYITIIDSLSDKLIEWMTKNNMED